MHPDSYQFFVGADYHLPHFGPLGDHTYLLGHKVTLNLLMSLDDATLMSLDEPRWRLMAVDGR